MECKGQVARTVAYEYSSASQSIWPQLSLHTRSKTVGSPDKICQVSRMPDWSCCTYERDVGNALHFPLCVAAISQAGVGNDVPPANGLLRLLLSCWRAATRNGNQAD